MLGSEWIEKVKPLGTDRPAVMREVLRAVEDGGAVAWPMQPIDVGSITFFAAMDYFAIGEPTDFVRVPLDPITASKIDGFTLPTARMVDLIWKAADCKLRPQPMGPPHYPYDSSMMSVERFETHNAWIEEEIDKTAARLPMAKLFAGHKKDVVLSNRLLERAKRVAIYGWHRSSGEPIQGPFVSLAHVESYYDYSHGWRQIGKLARVGGVEVPLSEVLQDPQLCVDLCTEPLRAGGLDRGPLRVLQYPAIGTPKPKPAPKPTSTDVDPYEDTEPPTTEPSAKSALDEIAFVQARNFRRAQNRKIDLIVIHTMEAAEKPNTAENVAAWFAGPHAPMASAHYNVDGDSIVQSVREDDVAFAAPGANHNGIQIEHAGYARQIGEQWNDEYSQSMLRLSAKLVADICRRHQIPIEFVDVEGLKTGKRGITYHVCVSDAFKRSTHRDPGTNFPLDQYLDLVRSE